MQSATLSPPGFSIPTPSSFSSLSSPSSPSSPASPSSSVVIGKSFLQICNPQHSLPRDFQSQHPLVSLASLAPLAPLVPLALPVLSLLESRSCRFAIRNTLSPGIFNPNTQSKNKPTQNASAARSRSVPKAHHPINPTLPVWGTAPNKKRSEGTLLKELAGIANPEKNKCRIRKSGTTVFCIP